MKLLGDRLSNSPNLNTYLLRLAPAVVFRMFAIECVGNVAAVEDRSRA